MESIAPSPICTVVIIPYACRDIEGYDTIGYQRVTIRLLVSITGDVLHAQATCIFRAVGSSPGVEQLVDQRGDAAEGSEIEVLSADHSV